MTDSKRLLELIGRWECVSIGPARSLDEITLAFPSPLDESKWELAESLANWNGFYAFGNALHCFATSRAEDEWTLQEWNESDLWRCEYPPMGDDILFFAEDVFGNQFGISPRGVVLLDAETAIQSVIAESLAGWAEEVTRDPALLTGSSLLEQWERRHGALPRGKRLVPLKLFMTGGEFTPENLRAVDAADGMRYRGQVASQIADLPDGTRIVLEIRGDEEQQG